MKKIFLTSGLVLCMACPAFAAPLGDIGTDNYLVGTNQLADCTEPTLGSYTGPVVLEAKWVSNQATITLDDNYYYNNGDTVTWAPATPVPTAEKTLYTVYGVANSTPGAGVFYIPSGQSTKTAISNLTADTPAKTGYTFNGFYTEKGGQGTQYISNAGAINSSLADYLSGVDATGTLFAYWTADQYTISYDGGSTGGTSSVENSTSSTTGVDFDDTNIELAQNGFTATGYHFTGWQSSYDLEDNDPTTDPYTIYGTASSNYNDDYTVGTISVYRHPDNITLTATWAPNRYTVSYNCGGYTDTTNNRNISHTATALTQTLSAVITYDTTNNSFFVGDDTCKLDGYHFTGWTCLDGSNAEVTQASHTGNNRWNVASNVSCTANWAPNNIELTWRTGHDDNAIVTGSLTSSPDCTYDLGITIPTAPSREGYTFEGWKVNASGTPATAEERAAANSGGSNNDNVEP